MEYKYNCQQMLEIVSRAEQDDFLSAVRSSVQRMTETQRYEVYSYSRQRNSLVVSFDRKWKPFWGYSFGFNQLEVRTYIRRCKVLRMVGFHLESFHFNINGGRVFMDSKKALRVDEYNQTHLLCNWYWVTGDDIVRDVQNAIRY